jgi:hypothetical protein
VCEVSGRNEKASAQKDDFIYVNGMHSGALYTDDSAVATLTAEYLGSEIGGVHAATRLPSMSLAKQLLRKNDATASGVYCEGKYQSREGNSLMRMIRQPLR